MHLLRCGIAVCIVTIVASLGSVRGQEPVVAQIEGAQGQLLLTPEVQPGVPMFASDAPVTGPVIGPPVVDPGLNANVLQADFGFEYLQPHWSNRAVHLSIPPAPGSPGPLGGTGNLSSNFAFIPQFGLSYQFSDLGFGVGATAKLLSLSGHDTRTLNATSGSALLNAQSGVDIATVNLVEGTMIVPLEALKCCEHSSFADSSAAFSLGVRYAYLRQDFSANLSSGTNVASLSATQDLNAFGVTSSIGLLCPVSEHFALFANSRGSVIVGPNNRSSTVTLVTPANPTGSNATVATENRTVIIPTGEFEIGILWGTPVRHATAPPVGTVGPLLWVRVSLVAEVWGDAGFIPSATPNPSFSGSNLLLYGFAIMGGIDY